HKPCFFFSPGFIPRFLSIVSRTSIVPSMLDSSLFMAGSGYCMGLWRPISSTAGHSPTSSRSRSGVLAWLGLKATGFGFAFFWLAFVWPWLTISPGQANKVGFGLALAWLGPSHGLEVQN